MGLIVNISVCWGGGERIWLLSEHIIFNFYNKEDIHIDFINYEENGCKTDLDLLTICTYTK